MKINRRKIELILSERNMTKTALGDNSGISRQNMSTILGRGTCEPKTAAKLANGLGVQIFQIIENEF